MCGPEVATSGRFRQEDKSSLGVRRLSRASLQHMGADGLLMALAPPPFMFVTMI